MGRIYNGNSLAQRNIRHSNLRTEYTLSSPHCRPPSKGALQAHRHTSRHPCQRPSQESSCWRRLYSVGQAFIHLNGHQGGIRGFHTCVCGGGHDNAMQRCRCMASLQYNPPGMQNISTNGAAHIPTHLSYSPHQTMPILPPVHTHMHPQYTLTMSNVAKLTAL